MNIETLPARLYLLMWVELRKSFGEMMEEDSLELMDAVEGAIIAEYQEEHAQNG